MARSILPALAVGLAVGVGAHAPAHAQAQAAHDIPWYMANDRARAATLDLCRSDHSYDRDTDCANAETAENRLWAARASAAARGAAPAGRGRVPDPLSSPMYWVENPLSRIGRLAACRNPVTSMTPEQCAAVRRGELMARSAAGGR